jgi:GNAT superfamily N-acetyltransferase
MNRKAEEDGEAGNRKIAFDDYSFVLEFNEGTAYLDDVEPTRYLYKTQGKVVAVDYDDEHEQRIEAGRFRLYYIDVLAAVDAGASVFDIFDCKSDTLDYYPAIFDMDTEGPSDELLRLFKDGVYFGNVLIVDRLEILPEFRSHNIGLVVMIRLIERFSAGASIVAIKPFPLQRERFSDEGSEWRQGLKLADLDKNLRRATAKLRRHYAKLGFKAMRGTPFMFRLTEEGLPAPESLRK